MPFVLHPYITGFGHSVNPNSEICPDFFPLAFAAAPAHTPPMSRKPKKGRRARGTGSVFYHEGRQRWVARVVVGKKPNGKPLTREVWGRTRPKLWSGYTAETNRPRGSVPRGRRPSNPALPPTEYLCRVSPWAGRESARPAPYPVCDENPGGEFAPCGVRVRGTSGIIPPADPAGAMERMHGGG